MIKDCWTCMICGFQGTKKEMKKHNKETNHNKFGGDNV